MPLLSLSGFETGYRTTVFATTLVACVLFWFNRRRIRLAHCILFAGFLVLAFMAVRNVPLFYVAAVPIIAFGAMQLSMPASMAKFANRRLRIATATLAVAAFGLLAVPVARHAATLAVCPPGRALSPFRFPEKISDYLEANPIQGEMFNDIRYGGYLIWRLYPHKKVFTDGRIMIRPSKFFSEYLAICEDPARFQRTAEEYNITQVLAPAAIFPQYRKLIKRLSTSLDWHIEYTDGTSFLIVKNSVSQRPPILLRDPAVANAIADSICAQWRNAPYVREEALGYFCDMLRYLGYDESAEAVRQKVFTTEALRTQSKE
jgi:hypothetical protein